MSDVSTKHPALSAVADDWALIDALNGGTRSMRAAGDRYMPKWPLEDDAGYKTRLAVSTLFPAYSETIATMVGRVFSKPLKVSDDVPQEIAGTVLQNVDLEGRNIDVFARDWFESAMNYGLSHALIDYPRTNGARTLADERLSGARPYVVLVQPRQVLGWRSAKVAGTERLTQFRFIETVSEDDGDFGMATAEQIRVLEPGSCRLYRRLNGNGDWTLTEEFATSLDVIPLVTLYTNRTGFMQGRPPLIELAHLNVKHWQSQSDQDTILHTARVPLLARIGAGTTIDSSGNTVEMQIGGSLVDLPADGDLKYVEHTGAAISSGQSSIEALEQQMQTAGAKLLTKTVLSLAETQAADERAKETSRLGVMAQGLEDSLDRVLDFAAMWMQLGDDGGHIDVEADLDTDAAPAQTMDVLLKMVAQGVLSSETAFREAQRRGLVSDEAQWEAEQERIRNGMSA